VVEPEVWRTFRRQFFGVQLKYEGATARAPPPSPPLFLMHRCSQPTADCHALAFNHTRLTTARRLPLFALSTLPSSPRSYYFPSFVVAPATPVTAGLASASPSACPPTQRPPSRFSSQRPSLLSSRA